MTIVLLTCSYRGQEFVRVGYFINNDYSDPELRENPPQKPQFEKLSRNILASKPRVTRFKINWDDMNSNADEQMNGETSGFEKAKEENSGIGYDEMGIMDEDPQDENSLVLQGGNENSNSLAMMEC